MMPHDWAVKSGDAINASGLVHARVYYELNPETGKSEFVGRERMMQLLAGYPTLHAEFEKETSESAESSASICVHSVH